MGLDRRGWDSSPDIGVLPPSEPVQACDFVKFVISPWLGKNMIPRLRDSKPEHIVSSLQQLGLVYTVLESPLALTRVVNSYRAPCLTWQHWVTTFPLPVTQWSMQLPCSLAFKFSDLPVASFLFSQIGMDTKKWWWLLGLQGESQIWAVCQKDMTEWGMGQPAFPREFHTMQCEFV